MENKLKLHEAIRLVLEEAKLPLTAREIADAINQGSLYSRKDGKEVPSSQIHARVKNYQTEFEKIDGRITLLEHRERGAKLSSFGKIETLIWESAEYLRGVIPTNEYYVLLFILSLKNEGLIQSEKSKYISASDILENAEQSNFYRRLTIFFTGVIKRIASNDLTAILRRIDQIDLQPIFPEIFDAILRKIEIGSGKGIHTNSNPLELNELLAFLGQSENPQSVYNPFAGTLSLLNEFHHNDIVAQEINQMTWAIGQLRLRAHGLDNDVDFTCEDSIQNWQKEGQFDLILSTPPFGARINQPSNHRLIETFLIEEGLNSLNNEGKLITIIPLGFLFRGGQEGQLRKKLIEEDVIEMIVQLPANLFPHTSIPCICLVLNKAKINKGEVRFFDASSFFKKVNRNQVSLNIQMLKEHLASVSDSKFSKGVKLIEIEKNDFNLNVTRYFMPEAVGVKLEDFVKPIELDRPNESKGKLIKISHLKEGKSDLVLTADEVGDSELRHGVKALNKSALLVALRWKTLKATVFKFEGTPIHLPNDIIALDVEENFADLSFLAMYLNTAENVLLQVKSFSVGSSVPLLRKADFFSIKVELPSLEEQKNTIKAEAQLQAKIKELVDDSISIEEKLKSDEKKAFEEFSSLKHSTGTPRQNILSNSKTLIRFFKNEESGAYKELNEKFKERYDIDMLKMITLIKSDIDHISKMFDVGERGLILSDFEKEDISIDQIGNYFKDLTDHTYRFNIVKSFIDLTMASPDTEDGQEDWEENYFLTDAFYKDSEKSILTKSDIKISGNWTLFKILMENILSNADKHGFDEKLERNQLSIEITLAIYGLTIKIQNNGNPFPRGFDKQKFIAKFSTANKQLGTGIGGYDINRIADYFGNEDWKLELEDQNEFPVSFEFNFKTDTL